MGSPARHATKFRNWVLCLLPTNRLLASIHLLPNRLHKTHTLYSAPHDLRTHRPRALTEVQHQRYGGTVGWYLSSSYIWSLLTFRDCHMTAVNHWRNGIYESQCSYLWSK